MSIHAYKINEWVETAQYPTFDLHNEKFVEFLDRELHGFYLCLNSYGVGDVDVPIEVLEKAIANKRKLKIDRGVLNQLKIDISNAKLHKQYVVTYRCR